jgi:hypothetical protein
MNCLRSLERWDRRFESHSRHGCLCSFILCANTGRRGGKPATNRLSYGAACHCRLLLPGKESEVNVFRFTNVVVRFKFITTESRILNRRLCQTPILLPELQLSYSASADYGKRIGRSYRQVGQTHKSLRLCCLQNSS